MNGAVDLSLHVPELSFRAAGDASVSRSVLPSGLRILTERVPGARSATIGFWVAAGSRDEAPATYGSTHFLEHLLFKGTAERTALDIAIAFDSVGGEHNAATAKEYTCYYAKVRDLHLPMAVAVLADMVASSLIDPVEFETERGVILEELAMADDDPADVVNERFFEAVLGEHPLGRPIGGDPDTIRAATRSSVWEHYRANYRPDELVITAAGAVNHAELVALASAALTSGGWDLHSPQPPRGRRSTDGAPLARGSAVTIVERPTEQVHLLLGMPGITATDERKSALGVLNSVLGGGMSSRLFQEVRERRGLAYSVYSFAPAFSDAGVFGMYAACSPANAGQVSEILLSELDRLAADGISAAELGRAVGQLSGATALSLEDSDVRMSRLGRSEITAGEFVDLDETIRRLAAVTEDDVLDLAIELGRRPLSVAAVGAVDPGRIEQALSGRLEPVPAATTGN